MSIIGRVWVAGDIKKNKDAETESLGGAENSDLSAGF